MKQKKIFSKDRKNNLNKSSSLSEFKIKVQKKKDISPLNSNSIILLNKIKKENEDILKKINYLNKKNNIIENSIKKLNITVQTNKNNEGNFSSHKIRPISNQKYNNNYHLNLSPSSYKNND